ncbi:MAG TPA: alpha/beta hydrolase [Candidatus Hydrogenedens sp.]|nr:alpha/beta hydrolase [Candidatus Hydrogenedens sp.]HOL18907.1 alpha/beta hydrolase [Candidatus Hydrogenedens sp.]HPP57593.1 alpha/beta hydrolase [Candidatus Hydrogenedens sp.]
MNFDDLFSKIDIKNSGFTIKLSIIVVLTSIINISCAIFHQQQGHYLNNDITFHYLEKGQGTPVILIHGILANADLNWRLPGITKKLSRKYHVIAFDLRGHGKSEVVYGVENYGLNLVEDVRRIMDSLKIQKAHIVGYSLGGFIALKFATLYPERAYSVTVAGAGWEKQSEENIEKLKRIYNAMREKKDCTPLFELVGMEKKGFGRISIAFANCYAKKTNDLDAIADLLESVTALEVEENDLSACQVPILLIGGTADPMCKTINELSTVLPNDDVVWIEGGTHLTTLLKKKFASSVENFITKNNPN